MAEPLASFGGFEGFEALKGFEGQFRATRKKGFGAPEPRARSLRNCAQSPEPTVKCEVLERLKRPESRSWLLQLPVWQNHLQVSGGLRGLRRLRGLKGSFGPLGKKNLARQSPVPAVCATAPTVWDRAQSPQSSKCEVLEGLKRPESRSWLLQLPVWQNHWQVSGGLRGLRRLRGLKGSFGPLGKKGLARQSPEPAVCATAPTVWDRAQGFGASEAFRIQKLAAPTASMAEPLARFGGFEGKFRGV